ncbi:hypothetical protein ACPCSP_30765 [Streptomyces cinereoruber]|uniref:hypothetical protein n=1 Tax=Streptomyces cinereoruber TaxID=67260 RepID=UPI003C2E3ABA
MNPVSLQFNPWHVVLFAVTCLIAYAVHKAQLKKGKSDVGTTILVGVGIGTMLMLFFGASADPPTTGTRPPTTTPSASTVP